MKKQGKQGTLFPETDSALAKACDAMLDARDALEKATQGRIDAQVDLIEQMHKSKRQSVKHNGRTFSIRQVEAREAIAIRE